MITEAAVVALMFPVARYVLMEIGLPWLYELRRYSEQQRQQVHERIDQLYRSDGIDPEQAEAASDALIEHLERLTDGTARSAWEHLQELFQSSDAASDDN